MFKIIAVMKLESKFVAQSELLTRYAFVKHWCPSVATKSKYGKVCKSYILTLPHSQGHGMSVKGEE